MCEKIGFFNEEGRLVFVLMMMMIIWGDRIFRCKQNNDKMKQVIFACRDVY